MTTDPTILCHPNIPKPLHGIAPRVVLGQAWWDLNRQAAYAKAGYCCEACGVAKRDARYHQWLEAHEFYDFDYPKGLLTLNRLVALCHSCHNFIHNGRMLMMVRQGQMTEEKRQEIIAHGTDILIAHNLMDRYEMRHDSPGPSWGKWRMKIDGKLYGPSSASYDDWMDGAWRNWKPVPSK